ncbi:MAG: cysteine--tRNA ligase [Deltaproteobacteria bacterium]|nr:cysteine--tRNA ligase [Deltaproteobacteria bacterium]
MGLRIFSTHTGEKHDFAPIEAGHVRMYVCGITSYAPSHIGHARCYVAFDAVYRWLKRSFSVTYVRNFTDVDDKIIKAARETGDDPLALSLRFIHQFHEDMTSLGCLSPQHEPRVSETIPEIITLIEALIAKGHAYPADGDVYFDVPSFAAYGTLSRRTRDDLADLEAGARVEVDPRKRSPHDFALWKAAKPGEPWWDSPWGKGRPGWHIECSAMSKKYLGETFDLHGGGKDLVFPHHENELAQSCAASGHAELARFWLHNGFVNLLPAECPKCNQSLQQGDTTSCSACRHVFTEEELKMSKSRGNFYPIREVISAFEPEALRLLLLGSHYRSPIAFSHHRLEETERRLDKIYETLQGIDRALAEPEPKGGPAEVTLAGLFGIDAGAKIQEAMDDDFNTAKAIAELSEVLKLANDLLHGTEKERLGRALSAGEKRALYREIRRSIDEAGDVLGLWRDAPAAYLARRRDGRVRALGISIAEIEQAIADRALAREAKDWKRSDEIRDALKARGIVVRDAKGGATTWEVAD